jgi:hypothetical protein
VTPVESDTNFKIQIQSVNSTAKHKSKILPKKSCYEGFLKVVETWIWVMEFLGWSGSTFQCLLYTHGKSCQRSYLAKGNTISDIPISCDLSIASEVLNSPTLPVQKNPAWFLYNLIPPQSNYPCPTRSQMIPRREDEDLILLIKFHRMPGLLVIDM